MKVNFKQLTVRPIMGMDAVKVEDASRGLAEMIYHRGTGLPAHALALKIFNADGEVEIGEQEAGLIEQLVTVHGTPIFIDAILSAIGRNLNETKND